MCEFKLKTHHISLTMMQDGHSVVTLISHTGISIGGNIDGGCQVKLAASVGQIVIHGKVDGGAGTVVYYQGVNRVDVLQGIRSSVLFGAVVFIRKDWMVVDASAVETAKAAEERRVQEEIDNAYREV